MINHVLELTSHRPWPLPRHRWMLAQSWRDLLFAHWPVPVDALRALVPRELALDLYEDKAWIGIVPFQMADVRPHYLPAVPWLSAFAELNVRTYVRSHDSKKPHPGVYFFSLDAANPVAVAIARKFFMLPYFRARMNVSTLMNTMCQPHSRSVTPIMQGKNGQGVAQTQAVNTEPLIEYHSARTHSGVRAANFAARYAPTGPVYFAKPNTLEHWLTERYCFYTVDKPNTSKAQLYRCEIHHTPWPLQPAIAEIAVNSTTDVFSLPLPDIPPLLHFSRRLDVVAWGLEKVDS